MSDTPSQPAAEDAGGERSSYVAAPGQPPNGPAEPAAGSGPAPQRTPPPLPDAARPARPEPSDAGLTRRQGIALVIAAALTLGGAGYSASTLNSRQALASNSPRDTMPSNPAPSPRSAAAPSPSAPASTPTAASPTGPPASGPTADGLLQPPPPWERLTDAAAKTGRVDLARAVTIDGHGALSRTGLTTLGFDSGISRAWQAGASVLLVLDYTFSSARGATGFVGYGRKARDADPGFRRMSATGIPGAVAYRTAGTGAVTQVVLFSRGRSAYIVGVQGTPPAGPAGNVNTLARRQYRAAGA